MARSFSSAASDKVEVASSTDFDIGVGGFISVGGWVASTGSGATTWVMGRSDATGGLSGFDFYQQTTNFRVALEVKNAISAIGNITPGAGPALNDGSPHHICVTLSQASGATNTLYVDGVSRGTSNNVDTWAFNSQVIRWGVSTDSFWTKFDGKQADWFWSNVLLTANEVAAIYAGVRPCIGNIRGIVSFWPFDGLVSPEIDLGGKAHNGTLTGTAFASGPPVTMLTPRWPLNSQLPAAATTAFRKTFSSIGTRTGSRQARAA
jgi:concanavalin A-like lectin/glucanase superfamily protein